MSAPPLRLAGAASSNSLGICYLLMSTDLCGGVRVVFDQARHLRALGHRVEIRAVMGSHDWYGHAMPVSYLSDLAAPFPANDLPDVVIATFWTTVAPALEINAPRTFHLCQGYEGDILEYADLRPRIEAAYRCPIPKLTIGPWLDERLRQLFGSTTFPIFNVGQIVDTALFTPTRLPWKRWLRRSRRAPWRLLIVGQFGVDVKAIDDALNAVRLLRARGLSIELLRVSPAPPGTEEQAITPIDAYHVAVPPYRMRDIIRSTDLLVAPSLEGEGFGLPLAEALACGVPCVATRIASFTRFATPADYAVFAPPDQPDALALAIRSLLEDASLRRRLQRRGPQVIDHGYSGPVVAQRLASALSAPCGHSRA